MPASPHKKMSERQVYCHSAMTAQGDVEIDVARHVLKTPAPTLCANNGSARSWPGVTKGMESWASVQEVRPVQA